MAASDPPVSISDLSHLERDPLRLARPVLRLQGFGSVRLQRWRLDEFSDPFWRLYLNLDEGAAITVAGSRLPLRAGCPYLLPAWLRWSGRSRPGVRHLYVHFALEGASMEQTRRLYPVPIPLGDPDAGRVAALLEAAAAAMLEDGGLGAAAAARMRAATELALACCFEVQPPPTAWPPELTAACEHVERNLAAMLTVEDLAAALRCSPGHCNRLFRRLLGTTPAAYLRERRIQRAADLLSSSETSIDAVADACGFGDRFAFTRTFTRLMGMPPARYRQSQRGFA